MEKTKNRIKWNRVRTDIKRNKYKYIIAIPVIIYLLLFHYKPMYGLIIAFVDYRPGREIWDCRWIGLKNFEKFFSNPYFFRTLRNTFMISIEQLLICFPLPIILALMLNEVKAKWFKVTVQTITYMPHFISLVIICGLVKNFCQSGGVINDIIVFFGGERSNLLLKQELFRPIYLASNSWQQMGWDSIIFLAALAGIDQEQFEAAKIDGAGRMQQIIYITLPGLFPTIATLLILKVGAILSVGYEKILLLYNEATYEVAEVISTYVYQRGLENAEFSYSTAVGLFNSIINVILLLIANKVSKKAGQSGLF